MKFDLGRVFASCRVCSTDCVAPLRNSLQSLQVVHRRVLCTKLSSVVISSRPVY